MVQKTINNGQTGNDGTGDTLRDAAGKINDNFTELYDSDAGRTFIESLKTELQASTDFADFKSRIAAL